ncbi:hypothetical protein AVEN_123531-1 [Araneus ventricosus]|uniref:Uncharacterized protein n=1 Tax=Araneus ventricosus TaxID=182803 RepID=A0A4Y2ULK2_ARAVE|nr:hypothetical protein AVEN_123531-1 [Araneus ventricosus]
MEFLERGKEIAIVEAKNLCPKNLNPKLHPPIPIGDLYARPAANQKICLHWDLASRLQIKLELTWVKSSLGGKNSTTLNLVSKQTLEHA